MAGFTLPSGDLSGGINALAQGIQQGQARQRQNELASLFPAALNGDQTATNRLAGLSPQLGMQLMQQQRQAKTDRTKEIHDFLSEQALGLAHLDEPQLQQAFPIAAAQWIQRYPELAGEITPEYDASVRPTIMGLAGIKPQGPVAVSAGTSLVNPTTGQPLYSAPPKPESAPASVQEYEYAKQQGYPGTLQQYQMEKARAGAAIYSPPSGYTGGPSGLTAIPGGPADPAVARRAAPTEFMGKSAIYAARAAESNANLDRLSAGGEELPGQIKMGAESIPLIGGALASGVNMLPGALGGPSGQQQQVEQAQRDFVNAILRQESGAAISPSEFSNARKQYFPQPGDKPEVKAQKARNRAIAIQGLHNNAGQAAFDPAPDGSPVAPPVPPSSRPPLSSFGR